MIFWLIVAYAVIGFFVGREVGVRAYEDIPDVPMAMLPAFGAFLIWPVIVLGAVFWFGAIRPQIRKRGNRDV